MISCEKNSALDFQLTFRYAEEKQEALRGASGRIAKGSCVVLCGGSGCGKSSVLRCVNHLIPQFYEGNLKGFCHINGLDTASLSIGETGKLAASVFQDPRSQFFTLNSSSELAFGLENFGMSQKDMQERVSKTFRQFHLEHLENRNVFELSSGERQLTAILSAWAMDTELFLLDEPTANLDYDAVLQLRKALSALKDAGKTLLISEHRLFYLTGLADAYFLMEDGMIKNRFSADEMASFSPDFLKSCGLRTTNLRTIHPDRKSEVPQTETDIVLSAESICFHYPKSKRPICSNLSMQIHTGEVVGLVGHNGCGKTTFGKLLAGLYKPSSGRFCRNGKQIKTCDLCRQSIFIMQEAEFQFFTNSVMAEVTYGLPSFPKEETERLLKLTGLWEHRNKHPFSLSGGQMQKLALLLACVSPKEVVILDEPTAGLDYRSLQDCMNLIRDMQKKKCILIITHDPELIAGVCTRCIRIDQGQAVRNYLLTQDDASDAFDALMDDIRTQPQKQSIETPADQKKKSFLFDPRIKLLMLLLAMIVSIGANPMVQIGMMIPVMAAAAAEHHRQIVFAGGSCFLLLALLFWGIPSTATSFLWYFFLRVLLIFEAASLLLLDGEASRTLAGLRKLHVPERGIMICSVMFRFFPVLSADLHMMSQSVKTRGFFKTLREKIKGLPEYLEILIVPMVFRVIRIADALSASAETRGIALPGRRDTYETVRFGIADFLLLCILILPLTGSVILYIFS